MSYINSKLIRIQTDKVWNAFAWGYIDNLEIIPDSFASYIRNWRLKWWVIEVRPWFSHFVTFTNIGLSLWIRQSDNKIIVRTNQADIAYKFVLIDEDWIQYSLNATEQTYFQDFKVVFIDWWTSVYCCNWHQKLCRITWNDFYIVDDHWGATWWLRPWFWIIFADCMRYWWDYTLPNRLSKSVANNYEDFTSLWKQTFDFWETLVWLAATNETLYIFTKNTISSIWIQDISQDWSWYLFFNTRTVNAKEWAINHNSIVTVWINTYFLTPNNKIQIIARWTNNNWYEIIDLSHRQYRWIDKIMATLDNDQSDSFWIYLQKESLIKWHLKKEWSTYNDIIIIYDIINDKFLIDEYKYFNSSVILNWQQYSLSAVENKIFKDEYWNDDDDSWIDFEYHTKEFDFFDPFRKKILWETILSWEINELWELIQEIHIDWNIVDTKTIIWIDIFTSIWWIWTNTIWTEAIWTEWEVTDQMTDFTIYRTKWNLNKKWKKIKYVYKFNSIWWKLRLIDLQHRIELLSEVQSELT